jgi:acyl-coenzyme A synthetase/AMP-(fatty) acid ligase
MPAEAIPLTSRAPDEVLVRHGGGAWRVGRFLADVAALAERLPDEGPAVNLCADRYRALVAFGAALSRGHVTLLSADRSTNRLNQLAAMHGAAYVLAEDGTETAPLPLVAVGAWTERPPEPRHGPNFHVPADRIAAIAFTSGSTGEPTPHLKPWGSLVAHAQAAAERFRLTACDEAPVSVIATVPPQHMYGFETTLMLPLHSAASVFSGPAFYPSDVAEALAACPGRRILVTTPLQLRALLASDAQLAPLDAVISATAPLAEDLAAAAERAWDTRVLEIYGATEAGSLASRRTLEGNAWLPYRGVRFRIAGRAAVVEVPGLPHAVPLADEIEEIGSEEGAEGRFRLLGRRADIVKLAGKRASLAGLNRILNEIEGVEDGVFVAPEDLDANPAARLSAFVVAPGRSAQEIVAALRERVEAAFLPRPVVMLPALPRDGVGKLQRRALAALMQRSPA